MAIELRCPDCRAKLRLKEAPEPGTEVECPKCGTAFAAPELEPEEEDAPKPKKKKKDATGEKGDQGEKKPKKAKGPQAPKGPRKRKAKKQETSKLAFFVVIGAGIFLLIFMACVLIWFFTRTSKAVEMFYYVPEDAQTSVGMNLGHARKYPEFYKSVKSSYAGTDFQSAGDAIGKAAETDMDGLVDYMVRAESTNSGWAIVFRTTFEFDGGTLAKLPGAKKKTLNGVDYYSAPNLLTGGGTGLTFSPTPRLIVVCPEGLEGKGEFKNILAGHAGSQENTLGVRMGALGKRITRGTFWQMTIFDKSVTPQSVFPQSKPQNPGGAPGAPGAPPPPPAAGGDDPEAQYQKVALDALNGSKGYGVKASLGSREVRFEIAVWYDDSDKASEFTTKQKESELGKGDSGDPPRWFKSKTQGLGDKKVGTQILSNIGFSSSGGVFYVTSEAETVEVQKAAGGIMTKVTGAIKGAGSGQPRRRRWPVRKRVCR